MRVSADTDVLAGRDHTEQREGRRLLNEHIHGLAKQTRVSFQDHNMIGPCASGQLPRPGACIVLLGCLAWTLDQHLDRLPNQAQVVGQAAVDELRQVVAAGVGDGAPADLRPRERGVN